MNAEIKYIDKILNAAWINKETLMTEWTAREVTKILESLWYDSLELLKDETIIDRDRRRWLHNWDPRDVHHKLLLRINGAQSHIRNLLRLQ